MREPIIRVKWIAALAVLAISLTACPSGTGPVEGGGTETLDITVTLSVPTVLVLQDETPAPVDVTIGRTAGNPKSVTLTAAALPGGMQTQFIQPGSGSAGTVTFFASGATPAGAYTVTVQASDGGPAASQTLTVVVGIVASVGGTVDTNLGVGGRLQQVVGVGFEPDNWRSLFLPMDWETLGALGIGRMSVHTVDYIPMKANTGQASDWDFTDLDQNLFPAFGVGDHSPLFTIAQAPSFLNAHINSGSGVQFVFNDANLETFTQYCANLVRYYNTGGFDWEASTFSRPAASTSPGGRSSTSTISTACCRASTSSSTTRLCRP